MLAGVSGGLARYFEIHPAVFRVGFVVLTLLGGAGILIYARRGARHAGRGQGGLDRHGGAPQPARPPVAADRARPPRRRGAILLSRATLWPDGDAWVLFLIAGGADPLDHAARPRPTPRPRTRRSSPPRTPRRVRRVAAPARRSRSRRSSRSSLVAVGGLRRRVRRAPRPRRRRPHVRRHERARSCAATTGSGSATLDLDLGALQLPAGETHVEASVDVGELARDRPGRRRAAGARGRPRSARSSCSAASAATAATSRAT